MKYHIAEPLKALKKFSTIGLSKDVLTDLEQKARDDKALPPKHGQLTRLERHCIRHGILGISQSAPLFLLAVQFGKKTGRKNKEVLEKLALAARELNRVNGQLTALIRGTSSATAKPKKKR